MKTIIFNAWGGRLLAIWIPVARETLKILVIIAYTAISMKAVLAGQTPLIFMPLLAWALAGNKR